jgi:hypothetical protein
MAASPQQGRCCGVYKCQFLATEELRTTSYAILKFYILVTDCWMLHLVQEPVLWHAYILNHDIKAVYSRCIT